jgi:N-formylglutamate amidohydrolase
MSARLFTLMEPASGPTPLVVDSPHSGCDYFSAFRFICPRHLLRQTEDFAVDKIVSCAVDAGTGFLAAEFPRSYIDANRAEDDIDPAVLAAPWPTPLAPCDRTLLGLGLVRRLCKSGVPVYGAPLPVEDVQQRIENCYRPYHAQLETLMARRHALFGETYLIDAHSMPSRAGGGMNATRPDFVLGDRQGTSCDPAFTRLVRDALQELGFSVALNDPYKGMEIVRRHGQPSSGRHALQMEINRRLYMNEDALTLHEGFPRLRRALGEFFRRLTSELMRDRPDQLAAE